ncbi:hypothetical protein H310_00072 [Aphanomyces invadans]|uniref:Uncharacterized protein n=1 Tax=Aphanomyces invadans TaxID=157072 RepID=A0A024UT43_9STRA|nr:hypothetical protein H310_00072 [Aphanomyces invadans]ETW09504.1 hypothetical protein H310_00072 [Aphanomyces invadans]|eukprot:XP_008860915.1 hypothetical protein H310_00072 [Aphanomyces invadans]
MQGQWDSHTASLWLVGVVVEVVKKLDRGTRWRELRMEVMHSDAHELVGAKGGVEQLKLAFVFALVVKGTVVGFRVSMRLTERVAALARYRGQAESGFAEPALPLVGLKWHLGWFLTWVVQSFDDFVEAKVWHVRIEGVSHPTAVSARGSRRRFFHRAKTQGQTCACKLGLHFFAFEVDTQDLVK